MSDGLPRWVWVDGELRPADGTHLSVFDRGFQLGDGLFETLRARRGRVTELAEHAARLRRSADGLAIALSDDIEGRLADGIAALLAAEGLDGPDGALGASILIRTFVADGQRLTLHVGGGITWRSDPADEWDETVAKARGPLSSIGAVEVAG